MSTAAQLSALIERIDSGRGAEEAREEAARLLQEIDPAELVEIEEHLVRTGLAPQKIRHLCSAHMAARSGSRDHFRASLPEGHLVARMMDEHRHILSQLDRLEQLVTARGDVAPPPADLQAIQAIGEFLIGTEPHHQREEQVLFPLMIEREVAGPPAVMTAEHVQLRALKHRITEGARRSLGSSAGEAWPAVRDASQQLIQMLRDHIFKEDNILYPMAVQLIRDPAVWDGARERCDAIGYCCKT